MRLNKKMTVAVPPVPSEAQSILRSVIESTTQTIAIDPHITPWQEPGSSCCQFFENYYVKPNTEGLLPAQSTKAPLSTIEADILQFFLSTRSTTRPYFFIDHAGRGKSTILKYLSFYLYHKEPSIQNRLLPIYISLRTYENEISELRKVNEFHNYVDRLIKERAFEIAYDHFRKNSKEILSWLNLTHPSDFQGAFPDKTATTISLHPEQYLQKIRDRSIPQLVRLVLGILSHYSRVCCPIVLIIDDADNFSIDVQRAILDYAKLMIPNAFRVLVALRVSTWKSLESCRRDYEPYESREQIRWSVTTLKEFLCKRLDNTRQDFVTLKATMRIDVNQHDIVNSFLDLLSSDKTIDFLIRTSNYNLHSLVRKMLLIPNSLHFNDALLVREHLSEKVGSSHGEPLWRTFNLIFGNHNSAFRSDSEIARSGIINTLCNRDEKQEAYTFFVRLHLLARLRGITDEASCLKMKELKEEYRLVVGNSLSFTKVFERSIYRLVQSGLIVTKSCRRYQSAAEVHEHINEDAVFITEAGIYYIEWLVYRLDYLYFMKDDIDWPDKFNKDVTTFFEDTKLLIPFLKKCKLTLRALLLLMKLEVEMLSDIRRQLAQPDDGARLQLYRNFYSGKKALGDGAAIMFTENMLSAYKDRMRRIDRALLDGLKDDLQTLESLRKGADAVLGAY